MVRAELLVLGVVSAKVPFALVSARDADLARHAVDVLPPEGADLALPHARHEREEPAVENGSAPPPRVWLSCRTLWASGGHIGGVSLLGASARFDGIVPKLSRPHECGLEQRVRVGGGVAAVATLQGESVRTSAIHAESQAPGR